MLRTEWKAHGRLAIFRTVPKSLRTTDRFLDSLLHEIAATMVTGQMIITADSREAVRSDLPRGISRQVTVADGAGRRRVPTLGERTVMSDRTIVDQLMVVMVARNRVDLVMMRRPIRTGTRPNREIARHCRAELLIVDCTRIEWDTSLPWLSLPRLTEARQPWLALWQLHNKSKCR